MTHLVNKNHVLKNHAIYTLLLHMLARITDRRAEEIDSDL